MALTLTLQEGDGFYVAGRRWYVESFDDDGIWLIGPPKEAGQPAQRVRITEAEAVEIEPEVFAQEGFIPEMGCRIALEAPRKIVILRDELFKYGGQGAQGVRNDPGKKA